MRLPSLSKLSPVWIWLNLLNLMFNLSSEIYIYQYLLLLKCSSTKTLIITKKRVDSDVFAERYKYLRIPIFVVGIVIVPLAGLVFVWEEFRVFSKPILGTATFCRAIVGPSNEPRRFRLVDRVCGGLLSLKMSGNVVTVLYDHLLEVKKQFLTHFKWG